MTTPIVTRLMRASDIGSIDDDLLQERPSHIRRVALRTDANFGEADYLAGVLAAVDRFTIPDATVNSFVGYWQPASALGLTIIRTDADPATHPGYQEENNRINRFGAFSDPQPLTVGGVVGYQWVSTLLISADFMGIPWVFRTDGALFSPSPRLVGWSDDETIDATDFASSETVTGYGNLITTPQHADRGAWLWVAVPADQPATTVGLVGVFGGLLRTDDVNYDGMAWAVWRSPAEQNAEIYFDRGFQVILTY